ncbi:hypothetical protein LINPERHAP1_LOCUS31839 [Linum perenne]
MASSRLKDVVIFHVLGRRVPFAIMNNHIQNLWAVRGQVLAKERPEVFEEYGPWMLAKSRSKRNVGAPNKTVSRPTAPTLGHAGPPPPSDGPPQGSRFTVLVDETPPELQIPQSTAVELVSSTPSVTAPQLGIQSGSKKQKGKKGAGLSPEGETNSANTTGKRASKSAIPKVVVSASTKGKGSSHVTILKRQRPAKNAPDPPGSAQTNKAVAWSDEKTNSTQPAPNATVVAVNMNVDLPTDGSAPPPLQ